MVEVSKTIETLERIGEGSRVLTERACTRGISGSAGIVRAKDESAERGEGDTVVGGNLTTGTDEGGEQGKTGIDYTCGATVPSAQTARRTVTTSGLQWFGSMTNGPLYRCTGRDSILYNSNPTERKLFSPEALRKARG